MTKITYVVHFIDIIELMRFPLSVSAAFGVCRRRHAVTDPATRRIGGK
jgi:hypothetical protein